MDRAVQVDLDATVEGIHGQGSSAAKQLRRRTNTSRVHEHLNWTVLGLNGSDCRLDLLEIRNVHLVVAECAPQLRLKKRATLAIEIERSNVASPKLKHPAGYRLAEPRTTTGYHYY